MCRQAFAAKGARRAYAAAQSYRLTSDWITSPVTADADLRAGMVQVRVRARDLAQNNDYGKAYLRALKKNVVGADGFTLQVKAVDYVADPKTGKTKPKPDDLANAILEQGFADWSRQGTCEMSGQVFVPESSGTLYRNGRARRGDVP